ncbi:LRR domain containing protein, partial [Trema orientale]
LEEWSFTEGEVEGGAFPCLKKLYLTGCPRLKVSLPGYLPSLRELKIDKCAQLLPLLPMTQPMDSSFPSLEIFIVSHCDGQDSLLTGGLPSSLKQIIILGCKNLTTLDEEAFQNLTSLEKLHIFSCDNLRYLPRGLTTCLSLKSLIIVEMSNLEECFFIEGEIEEGAFPRLEELHLKVCPRLEVSLPHNLPSLTRLEIEECLKLLPLFSRAQQMDSAFPSLEILTISGCDGQHSILEGGLPSSLKQIEIYNCGNLTTLDEEAFQHLTSLGRLDIISCDSLQCLPRALPTSLSTLNIRFCELLTPRLQRETGEDWPIIENIPIKRIW